VRLVLDQRLAGTDAELLRARRTALSMSSARTDAVIARDNGIPLSTDWS